MLQRSNSGKLSIRDVFIEQKFEVHASHWLVDSWEICFPIDRRSSFACFYVNVRSQQPSISDTTKSQSGIYVRKFTCSSAESVDSAKTRCIVMQLGGVAGCCFRTEKDWKSTGSWAWLDRQSRTLIVVKRRNLFSAFRREWNRYMFLLQSSSSTTSKLHS